VGGVIKIQTVLLVDDGHTFYIDDDHHHLHYLITITIISSADFITHFYSFTPHTHYGITVTASCFAFIKAYIFFPFLVFVFIFPEQKLQWFSL
jgi:hypothetical protein